MVRVTHTASILCAQRRFYAQRVDFMRTASILCAQRRFYAHSVDFMCASMRTCICARRCFCVRISTVSAYQLIEPLEEYLCLPTNSSTPEMMEALVSSDVTELIEFG